MLSTFLRRSRKSAHAPGQTPERPYPAEIEQEDSPSQLGRIAQASVSLAALGPKLAAFAAEMEVQAKSQAVRAETIAATMDAVAHDLESAVNELRATSGQLQNTLKSVERIADHTRLLSINASIEAASRRAGPRLRGRGRRGQAPG